MQKQRRRVQRRDADAEGAVRAVDDVLEFRRCLPRLRDYVVDAPAPNAELEVVDVHLDVLVKDILHNSTCSTLRFSSRGYRIGGVF